MVGGPLFSFRPVRRVRIRMPPREGPPEDQWLWSQGWFASQTGLMTPVPNPITKIAALTALLYAARRYYRNWGASKGECQVRLPGDELIGDPVIQVTEAAWIDAPASAIWPCLLRMGQNPRGLIGLRANEADRLDPESRLAVGDTVHLTSNGWMGLQDGLSLRVEAITPERSIVLRTTSSNLPKAVWSFHLEPHWATHTRLVARARVGLRHPGEVVAIELARPAIALTTRAVLLGIKRRVERQMNALMTSNFGS